MNEKGDTSICFSLPQSKFILKKIYRGELCDTLLYICENQIKYCDSVSTHNQKIINTLIEKIKNQKQLDEICNSKIGMLELEIENQKRQIVKHKIHKIAGFLAGIVGTSFMTYMYIRK